MVVTRASQSSGARMIGCSACEMGTRPIICSPQRATDGMSHLQHTFRTTACSPEVSFIVCECHAVHLPRPRSGLDMIQIHDIQVDKPG